MMRTIVTGIVLMLFALTACMRDSTVFSEYVKMENMNWNRFDVLHFDVPVKENDALDFHIFLRHHTNFPYDKLYVNITFYSPDGDMRSSDYEFDLKDYQGEWLAEGMGELWDLELPVRREMLFSAGGICKVRIENKYSKYDTPGIIEVGLIVKKSGERD